jgi:hypothetical protein
LLPSERNIFEISGFQVEQELRGRLCPKICGAPLSETIAGREELPIDLPRSTDKVASDEAPTLDNAAADGARSRWSTTPA